MTGQTLYVDDGIVMKQAHCIEPVFRRCNRALWYKERKLGGVL
ncbi:hypothetical protein FHS45_002376 [Thalassobacillus devorans]|nr:hypothetical protein [Thalassobacillus devorans]